MFQLLKVFMNLCAKHDCNDYVDAQETSVIVMDLAVHLLQSSKETLIQTINLHCVAL